MQKVKSKSFIIMTAIFMILIFALSNIDKIIDFFDNDSKVVAIQTDNDMIYKVLEKQYKQNDDIEKVEKDTGRDYWLSTQEAKDYGFINKIIKSRDEIK
mgnify:CR=1 FL=1